MTASPMNDNYVRGLEVLFYGQCQLEGMLSENVSRQRRGEAPAYGEDAFLDLAEQTRGLFRKVTE